MTYPEAVRTILNREDKDRIFKESLYLCAYLSDFIGNDLSQKHLLDVLMSLIKGESPKALLDEKELTRVANKNMFYPKEDVFQALSPFMKKDSGTVAIMPKEGSFSFSSNVIRLNKRKEISLGGAKSMTIDIPYGDITVGEHAPENKSYFTIYGKGKDLPNDVLIFQKNSEGALYLSFQRDALKKIKGLSLFFDFAIGEIQTLSIQSNGGVKASCTLETLTIEAPGDVSLKGNYINVSISTSGNIENDAFSICTSTTCY